MRKIFADEYFEELFDATYNNAVVYTVAATGTMEYTEIVLSKTYSQMYRFLRKNAEPTGEQANEHLINLLKENISKFIPQEKTQKSIFEFKSENDVKELLEKDFPVYETEFLESSLNIDMHSKIMKQPLLDRKIFLLYFYCSCNVKQISKLLEIENDYINSSIYNILITLKERYLD